MKTYDWIVVGGGIAGAALAYELVKTGFSVLLLEKDAVPQNATRYSYGGLAYWSGSTQLTRQLCQEARDRYNILSQELDADIELRELDLLLTISADSDPETTAASYAQCAVPPRLLTVKEACELEPLLKPAAIAGALTVKHGHINPQNTAQAYIRGFLRAGGELQIGEVLQVMSGGVKTTTANYDGANVVICAGGLSRKLLKSVGIPIRVYFTHAEIIEIPPVDLRLNTLVMPSNLQRFKLESASTKVDELWDEPDNQLISPILDVGAIQFLDGSLRLGQISRVLTDTDAFVNPEESENWLRQSISQILPALGNLPGNWHHCLVAFSSNGLSVIGAVPEFAGVNIFSGFSNPLVFIPPLAQRFAQFLAGAEDEIINQISNF
ncbi:NAD(P)/FAD-dependent oxidoreductase [Anabaena subtropica]|uniref:FAD-binding oxidoreductase n=1 Tax=Anabaena subtropica FACHB-260 TaxID=2692884 RepID=A0ABR8CRF3_9NOST|nr:FAD-dependent oxidoreductase [Anabaena subtropica]MBD2345118.1 FAD-binding oxidoreductase [Anabaena subtropica FACHB-260]